MYHVWDRSCEVCFETVFVSSVEMVMSKPVEPMSKTVMLMLMLIVAVDVPE